MNRKFVAPKGTAFKVKESSFRLAKVAAKGISKILKLASKSRKNKAAFGLLGRLGCPFVLIEWVDSHYRSGWTTQVAETKPLACLSAGWLVYDGAEAKTLSANVSCENDPQRCGDITIPARAIVRIEALY